MSIRKGGDGIGTRKNIPNPRPNRTKDKDEDLLLFRELHKREKDHVVSLLAPVSDDFEANGKFFNSQLELPSRYPMQLEACISY